MALADELLAVEVKAVEATEHGEGDSVGVEEVCGHGHDLFFSDSFDALNDFVEIEEALEVHLLAREIRHARHGAFEREEEIALELVLGATELAGLQGLGVEAAEFLHDEVDDLDRAVRRGSCRDAERACIAIGGEVGVDGVDKSAFFADGLKEAGAHASAEDSVEKEGDVAGLVADGWRGDAETKLHLLEGFFVAQVNARRDGGGRVAAENVAGRERAEVVRDHLDEAVVLDVAGGGKDHVAGLEALLEEADESVLLEAADGFAGSEDGLTEGMTLPEILHEDFVDQGVGTVLVHFDFFEDDAALPGDFFGGENGIEDEVGQDVEGGGDVLVEDLDVEADGFLTGKGVEVATDGIDLAGDALGGPGFGSLEYHVLDEMGDAVEFGDFVTRAGAHPDTHGDGADVLHALGEDDETVGEDSTANISIAGHFRFSGGSSWAGVSARF